MRKLQNLISRVWRLQGWASGHCDLWQGCSRFSARSEVWKAEHGGGRIELWTWGKGESGELGHGDENIRRSPSVVTSFSRPQPANLGLSERLWSSTPHAEGLSGMEATGSSDGGYGGLETQPHRKISCEEGLEVSSRPVDMRGRGSADFDRLELNVNVVTRLVLEGRGVGIACGLFHSCLWTGGRVWLWGKGDGGRLGLGYEDSEYSPVLLPSLSGVTIIALGGLHSAAITDEGDLFTWGYGGFGALGHGGYTRELAPKQVMQDGWTGKVVHVAAGGAHTAVVTELGAVYTWGRDEGEGRLGHSIGINDEALPIPVKVEGLPLSVVSVACGGFFTMALTADGQLWSWGGNTNYELGRGNRRNDWRPMPVTIVENPSIYQVACGGYHSAALAENGTVLTWGYGGHGQLGHGTLQSEKVPRVVEALAHQRVVSVACGSAWTAAVTEFGELYTWGKNRDCQLGVPSLKDIQMVPVLVGFSKQETSNCRVLNVAAGVTHGLAVLYRSPT